MPINKLIILPKALFQPYKGFIANKKMNSNWNFHNINIAKALINILWPSQTEFCTLMLNQETDMRKSYECLQYDDTRK